MYNESKAGMDVRKAITGRGILFAILSLGFAAALPLWMDTGCSTTEGLAETGLGFQLVARAQDSLKVIIEPQR
jgi:hypothetical protein